MESNDGIAVWSSALARFSSWGIRNWGPLRLCLAPWDHSQQHKGLQGGMERKGSGLWTWTSWMDANPYCHDAGSIPSGLCGVDGFYPKPRIRWIHSGVKSHPSILLLLGKWMGTRHGTAGAAKPRPCTGLALFPKNQFNPRNSSLEARI